MPDAIDLQIWEPRFERFLVRALRNADAGHDLAHIQRVLATAKQLAAAEQARPEVVVPAAWLHDCVTVAKNSPERRLASTRAAQQAGDFLRRSGYPGEWIPGIRHAIEAHSFSASIPPETIEAQVVQDADRLDALGAIGIARCLLVGADLELTLYHPSEPFPQTRPADDTAYILDHFYCKLLRLADTMQTAAGRQEARRRSQYMEGFLEQLGREIG
ncbi:MAG: HD domain-containing protein [Acidobacteriota bacterium]